MTQEILSPPQEEFPPSLINPTLDYIKRTAKEVALLPLLCIMGAAFSSGVRQQILRRDGYKCVICGSTEHLEACHTIHDRSHPNYNDPEWGETRCSLHHLQQHIEEEGQNGLTKAGNDWAIDKLLQRVSKWYSRDEIDDVLGGR